MGIDFIRVFAITKQLKQIVISQKIKSGESTPLSLKQTKKNFLRLVKFL